MNLKKKIKDTLERKIKTQKLLYKTIDEGLTLSKSELNELEKNEIEVNAQIKLLRFLLSKD